MSARARVAPSYRGDLEEQQRLLERFREHMAEKPAAPKGEAIYGYDWDAHDVAVARWQGGSEYFAKAMAEQLELHLAATGAKVRSSG